MSINAVLKAFNCTTHREEPINKQEETMKRYNELLNTYDKQAAWLKNNKKDPKIEIYLKKFDETLAKLNECLTEIQKDRPVTQDEIINGFGYIRKVRN